MLAILQVFFFLLADFLDSLLESSCQVIWSFPKFYIGTTNRNFNIRFKEHRKDFRYAEGKSKFSEHVLKEGHEMKTETMFIVYLENNHRKINTFEEIETLKAPSSKYLLNDVITGQNDPIYKLLPTSVI